jgi:hypothetical protein
MFKTESVVAVYDTHVEAESAVKELQEAGVDMKTLSIAAKDMHTDEQVVGYYNTGDRMMRHGVCALFYASGGLAHRYSQRLPCSLRRLRAACVLA